MIGKTRLNQSQAIFVLLLMLLAGLTGCKTPAPTQQSPMKKYYYTDAMSNGYVFTAESLSYSPIKPALSSSGEADGGEKKEIILSKPQFEALEALAKNAMADTDNHLATRNMGCGTLTLEDASGEETVFIKMNAESKARLEEALKDLLK